ncbi:hypothetical protein SLEP1_g51846 [Rubroshorea leprosula]|uniref:CG-1 domain-containing protein n=1 Tax=Rubroshorea leprosula TaxID=152421 RepID=A0AAV5M5B1_9ROSI|nr:hypothetical protein SLEP1_g51846 [Rubroshorea leprosula]
MGESAEAGPSLPDNPLDTEQIRREALHRWFLPDEICKIIQNHEKFGITSEPPDKPQSGSFFLFDRNVQKRFGNDGHNWKKKEAHQKLKAGSAGNLNCYYARGRENENFRRRRCWILEGAFSHIAFVHYLEITEKMEDSSCVKETQEAGPYSQETKNIMPNSEIDGSMPSSSHLNNCYVTENTVTTWVNCVQALEHESASSEYNHQPSSGLHSGLELPHSAAENIDAGGSDPYAIPCIDLPPTQPDKGKSDNDAELAHDPWRSFDYMSWKDILDSCTESIEDQSLFSPSCPDIMGKFSSNSIVERQDFGVHSQIQKESEASVEDSSSLSKQPMDQKLHSDSACDTTSKFHMEEVNHLALMNSIYPQLKRPDIRNDNLTENFFRTLLSNDEYDYALQPNPDGCFNLEGKSIHSSDTEHLFDGILTEEGSKNMFSSGANGETGENENENDVSSIPPEGKLDVQDINAAENYSDSAEANLLPRFVKMLRSGSSATNSVTSSLEDASQLSSKISSLLKEDNKELDQMKTGSGMEFCLEKLKDQLLQKHLKEKLHEWILQKVAEGGDGPRILDEGGLGVLHLAAALGYDWALEPTIVAGVSVDFCDVNEWTALHWAAFCGR